jgi:hypothetical protein
MPELDLDHARRVQEAVMPHLEALSAIWPEAWFTLIIRDASFPDGSAVFSNDHFPEAMAALQRRVELGREVVDGRVVGG